MVVIFHYSISRFVGNKGKERQSDWLKVRQGRGKEEGRREGKEVGEGGKGRETGEHHVGHLPLDSAVEVTLELDGQGSCTGFQIRSRSRYLLGRVITQIIQLSRASALSSLQW